MAALGFYDSMCQLGFDTMSLYGFHRDDELRAFRNFLSATDSIIFTTSVRVFVLSSFAKAALLGKELALAAYFGVSDSLDALLVAYTIPVFFINVLSGTFNTILTPYYLDAKSHHGRNSAGRLIARVNGANTLILVIVIIFVMIGAPYYLRFLAGGFHQDKFLLTVQLTYVLAPTILFSGLAYSNYTILNSEKAFAAAVLLPAISPLLIMLAIFMHNNNILAVSVALLLGQILEYLISLILINKQQKMLLFPIFSEWDSRVRRILKQYTSVIIGSLIMGGTLIVDQTYAASLQSGSVSVLNYGTRLVNFPLNMITSAISVVALSHLSDLVSSRQWADMRLEIRKAIYLALWVALPMTAALVIFSEPLIRLTMERGLFTAEETSRVVLVQQMAALQFPFYIIGIIAVRAISALRQNHILVLISSINLMVNIIANQLLIGWLGIAGVALSTSIVYCLSCCMILAVLSMLLKNKESEAESTDFLLQR